MKEALGSLGVGVCGLAAALASAGPAWLRVALFVLAVAFLVRGAWLVWRAGR